MQNVADSEQSHVIRGANISTTWIVNANMVNQLTGSFYGGSLAISTSANAARARDANFRVPRVFNTQVAAAGLIPSISMSQGYAGIDIRWPQNITSYTWEIIDNFSWVKGRHTIKFGGSLDKENKSQNQSVPNNNGTFTFNSQPTGDALAELKRLLHDRPQLRQETPEDVDHPLNPLVAVFVTQRLKTTL